MEHEERISFPNGRGQTLVGILHHPAAAEPPAAAILCHGMESDKESEKLLSLGRALAARGILGLRFDFACSGESEGKFEEITYSGEAEDLNAAFSFMLQYRVKKIGILGSSMGGTAALLFAAGETRVAALVTIAAPLHPEKFTDRLLSPEEAEQWRREGFIHYHGRRINVSLLDDLQTINVPQAAKKIRCPVLVIHGDADETVPVEEAHELSARLQGPNKLLILPGGDHRLSDPSTRAEALEEAVRWMTRHLR